MPRRIPLWITLVPVAAAATFLGIAISEHGRTQAAVEPVWVTPGDVELGLLPEWADPRWAVELEALLDAWPSFPADEPRALEALQGDLASLSFVAQADRPVVDSAGGLRIGLTLRRPVAAIAAGPRFLTVDGEGTVLSGTWGAPPRVEGTSMGASAWLPVLVAGRGPDGEPLSFGHAQAGDWLDAPESLAALDVARSLADHLGPEDRRRLGRIAIDGGTTAADGELDPGVQLLLEGQRLVVFGRPPSTAEPGELPAERKWAALSRALARLDQPGDAGAWDLADLRWDVPELRFRGEAADRVSAELEPAHLEPTVPRVPASWRAPGGRLPDEPRPAAPGPGPHSGPDRGAGPAARPGGRVL